MSSQDINLFESILGANGYHITKARQATFQLFVAAQPQSMNEILAKARGTVDRVTVYRNIELFEKLGIAHRIYIGWKYKLELSDQFVAHHHHLSCLSCGAVIDIADEQHINQFIAKIAADSGFRPRNHRFEVDGYCKNCQKI